MTCAHFAAATPLPIHTLVQVSSQPRPSSLSIASITEKPEDKTSSLQSLSIEDALNVLEKLTHAPHIFDLISILQKCRKRTDLTLAKRVHQIIRDKNFGPLEELGNYLIPMYVECGNVKEAEVIFDSLAYCNEHAWTSLIQGYTDCGDLQCAFDTFERMESGPIPPNRYTFMAILRTCIRSKSLAKGLKMHAAIVMESLDSDLFIGSTLVDMYVKHNSLLEARNVFDGLHARNVVSWTAMIKGYADNGEGDEALSCLEQMQIEGVPPDPMLLVCGLRACCSSRRLDKGLMLHEVIVTEKFEKHVFLGSTLVDMYIKCGMLAEAQDVFESLETKDVVSWTVIISGYVEHNMDKEALVYLERMQNDGVLPNAYTFNYGLKACCSMKDFDRARKLHGEIIKEGLESDAFLASNLIDLYAKHISLLEARDIFDELPARDVVMWTALMTGYTEQGFRQEALECLREMEKEGIAPDSGAYTCGLKSCVDLKDLAMGQELHAVVTKVGMDKDTFVGSAVVDMYAKISLLADAKYVFDALPSRTVVSWTALIDGYVENGLEQKALLCYEQMQKEDMSLDAITFVCSLKACGSIKAIDKGRGIHAEVIKEGLEENSLVRSTLVFMYAKCGLVVEAQEEFDQLANPDVIAWTALTTGYGEQGFEEELLQCFQQMQLDGVSPDAFAWNALIAGHAQHGDRESACRVYSQMLDQGLLPNNVTFSNVLNVCSTTAALEDGERIHAQVYGPCGFETINLMVANGLIDMYCKCGFMENAQQVFDAMPKKDLVSWNTLITGYGRQGKVELALDLFERMLMEGVRPEDITFLAVLSLCSHAGLVDKCCQYFEAMTGEYGIAPSVKHHNCVINLLGRAGRLNDLMEFIDRESFESDIVTWSTVLGACHKWGNVELGVRAFNHILESDTKNAAAFALMSNIYADAGMWEKAKRIEAMKMKIGAAGDYLERSWVETYGKLKQFKGEDKMDRPQNKLMIAEIESVLAEGKRTSDMDQEPSLNTLKKEEENCLHSERLATMHGLKNTPEGSLIRLVKNTHFCHECHHFLSLVSDMRARTIVCRDLKGFHFFVNGICSCRQLREERS
ncbi:hypothetical protein GOP47_0027863 [Adiantum capillus-veneris]|nr:hypothetical protein GOP47_0027863 [Adiantum capillus-veneris]